MPNLMDWPRLGSRGGKGGNSGFAVSTAPATMVLYEILAL